jgi:thiol-disulfide isomerase/thioredoxin
VLDAALARQAAADAALAAPLDVRAVTEVASVAHLEAVADAHAGCVLALVLHARSCGTCKALVAQLASLAASAEYPGVVFLKHDVRDAFDEATDLSRLHRVRSTPTLLLFRGGAAVRRGALADSRVGVPAAPGAREGGVRAWLRVALAEARGDGG